jgi:hypothetical protein
LKLYPHLSYSSKRGGADADHHVLNNFLKNDPKNEKQKEQTQTMKEQTSKLNETNVSFDKSVNVFDNYEKAAPISDSSHKD